MRFKEEGDRVIALALAVKEPEEAQEPGESPEDRGIIRRDRHVQQTAAAGPASPVQSQPTRETRAMQRVASLPFLIVSVFFVIIGVTTLIPQALGCSGSCGR